MFSGVTSFVFGVSEIYTAALCSDEKSGFSICILSYSKIDAEILKPIFHVKVYRFGLIDHLIVST